MRLAPTAARALPLVGAVLLFATCEPLTAPGLAGDVVLSYGLDSVMVVRSELIPSVAVTVGGTAIERPRFRFTSSDTSVVQVIDGERLLAQKRGTANVTVRLVSAVAQQPAPEVTQTVQVVAKRIGLASTSATLTALGDTVRLRGTAFDVNDAPIGNDSAFAWSSSDSSVALVSSTGLVTARRGGIAIIRLSHGAERNTDSATVLVQQRLSHFVFSPAVVQLDAIGAEVAIIAAARDQADSTIPGGSVATWTTDNLAVATVSATGRITARSDGTARVIATNGTVSDTIAVTVRQRATDVSTFAPGGEGAPATGFRLRSIKATLVFSATGRDSLGNTVARAVPVWTSTSPRVARIDTLGLLTALDTGTTSVVARIDGAADTVQLRVSNDAAGVMVLLADTSRLSSVGESLRLRARVLNAVGDSIAGVPVTWSSLDSIVATVQGDSATARGVGTARVVASTAGGAVADTSHVVVTNFASTAIMARRDTILSSVGDAFAPAITVANGRGGVVGRDAVAWSSSDTLVVSVSFTGTVTARGRGRALVRAVNPTNAAIRDSIEVEVTNAPASVVANTGGDTLNAIGAERAFRATIRNARGALLAGDRVTWRVEPASVATVNDTGLVVTRGVGVARLIADAGSAATGIVSDTVMLDARSIARSIAITSPSTDAVITARGSTLGMTQEARDSLGTIAPASGVRWRSLNAAVAKVEEMSGLVTATGVGSTFIVVDAAGGATDSRRVTVEDRPSRVNLVDVTRSIATVGATYVPVVEIFNANDSLIAERTTVQWVSRDPSIASVTAGGEVRAVAFGGPVYVVASSPFTTGKDSVAVTVTNVPAHIEIRRGAASASTLTLDAIGADAQLATFVTNSAGAELIAEPVTWSRLNPAVTSVSSSGVVTALGAGVDTVIVTPNRGSGVDSIIVTVAQAAASTTVSPLDTTLTSIGHTFGLRANARDRLGVAIPGSAVGFTSSNELVASVHATSGVVTAAGVGTATITATVAGVPGAAATVRVENRPDSVLIAQETVTIASIGDVFTPTVTVKNQMRQAIAGGASLVTWTSADPGQVGVSASGTITALAPTTGGPLFVRAINPLDPSRRDSILVTVTNAIASVTVLDGLLRTIPGDSVHLASSASTFQLGTVARNSSNAIVAATPTWGTSDAAVAIVSTSGLVTAMGDGRAVITATTGTVSDVVIVGVRRVARTVTLSQPSVTLHAVGATQALTATARDTAGALITSPVVRWSSSNVAVATVGNSSGTVTAIAAGSATITAAVPTLPGAADSVRASLTVDVTNAPAAINITLALDSLHSLLQSRTLATSITNGAGLSLPANSAMWSTDDAAVATVSGTGVVTAQGAGTTTIRATSPLNPAVTDAITIVVVNKPTTVTVSPGTPTLTALGRSVSLTSAARNGLGATIADATFEWISSNDAVATVSSTGVVTAVSVGTVTITARTPDRVSAGGLVAGTSTVTVRNAPATIVILPDSLTITSLTGTLTVDATLRNDLGATITGVSPTWTSSNPGIASVNAAGLVTGHALGAVNITASTLNDAGVTISDVVKVAVTNVPASINLSPDLPADSITLVSLTQTVSPAIAMANGLGVAITSRNAVTWSSDDATVASVSASGVVTAVGIGGTFIRATSPADPTIRDSVRVHVRNDPATVTIATTAGADTLIAAGQQITYTATARNALGATIAGAAISWSSSNDAVVAVTSPGASTTATLVSHGPTVTITASATSPAGTVSGTVTVAAVDPTMVYVSDGPVTGSRLGTRKRPLQRIADGIAMADPGDSVFVFRAGGGAGSYTEVVTIDRPLTLIGDTTAFLAGGRTDPSLLPVIRHTSGAAAVTTTTTGDVALIGFAIRHAVDGPAVDADGASMLIERVYVNPIGAAPASAIGRGFRLRNSLVATIRHSGARLVTSYGTQLQTITLVSVDAVQLEAAGGIAAQLTDIGSATIQASELARSDRGLVIAGTLGALTLLNNDVYDNTLLGADNLPSSAGHLANWFGDALGPRRAGDLTAAGDSVTFSAAAPAFGGFVTTPTYTGTTGTALRRVFGDGQVADRNTDLTRPLVVRVVDARGRPVAGVSVRFEVTAGGGKVDVLGAGSINQNDVTVTTDASGLAKASARTSGTAGSSSTVTTTATGMTSTSFTITTNP